LKAQKTKLTRPDCQRKSKGNPAKTSRGIPEIYDEKKRQFNTTLTSHAIVILEKIASLIGESRSQVIEKALRGEIDLLRLVKENNLLENN
jgi:hypothetical protein